MVFSRPRMVPRTEMRFTIGSSELSPITSVIGIEARRNAEGISSLVVPRVSGAAMVTDSKRPMVFARAVRPIVSGSSHAKMAAMAAFFSPRRWRLLRSTATSMGDGGKFWKTPSGSSSMAMIAGETICFLEDFAADVCRPHGSSWLPVPDTSHGGLMTLAAMNSRVLRSTLVPGTCFQHASEAASAAINTQSGRWIEIFTVGGSRRALVRVGPREGCWR